MATEMNEVPDSLANFSVNDVQKDSMQPGGAYQPSDSDWLGFNFDKLKQSISEAYLFIPQGEALGKISVSDINQSGIFFGRTDWPNPEKIFSLIAGDYEIRLNLDEAPSLIFLGSCTRLSLPEDTNESLSLDPPQYLLKVQKGWVLKRIKTEP